MDEDQAARRGSEEEGLERGEETAGEGQRSRAWDNRVEWDQQDLLMGLSGRESREAAGPEEAAEPEPERGVPGGWRGEGRAGWEPAGPGGGERAAPEGGVAAGLEGGRGGEGRGEQDQTDGEGPAGESKSRSEARQQAGSQGAPGSGTLRGGYWEGSRERHRERKVKRRAKGTKQVESKYRLEKKPNLLQERRQAETQKNVVLKGRAKPVPAGCRSSDDGRPPPESASPPNLAASRSGPRSATPRSVSLTSWRRWATQTSWKWCRRKVGAGGGSRRTRWRGGRAGLGARTPPPRARGPRRTLAALRPVSWGRSRGGVLCARQGLQDEQPLPGGWLGDGALCFLCYSREPGTCVL